MSTNRVLRGGSWYSKPKYARSALRGMDDSSARSFNVGFRLVKDTPVDRVIRGGSWNYRPQFARSADRSWLDSTRRNDFSGFRLVKGTT